MTELQSWLLANPIYIKQIIFKFYIKLILNRILGNDLLKYYYKIIICY